jgi:hypothetical protein
MKNKYRIEGKYAYIQLQKGHETKISTESPFRADEFGGMWYAHYSKCTKSHYVLGHDYINGKRKTVRLHRHLLYVSDPKILVDHVNHDTLDNADENINIVNYAENAQNHECKGYSQDPRSGNFQARIRTNGELILLGTFDTPDKARQAYLDAKKQYHKYGGRIAV